MSNGWPTWNTRSPEGSTPRSDEGPVPKAAATSTINFNNRLNLVRFFIVIHHHHLNVRLMVLDSKH
jgi:hypothetical protein